MEQLNYNLLLRWFVGMAMDDALWDATVFCKNRDLPSDGVRWPCLAPGEIASSGDARV